jgi:hypothetical protein
MESLLTQTEEWWYRFLSKSSLILLKGFFYCLFYELLLKDVNRRTKSVNPLNKRMKINRNSDLSKILPSYEKKGNRKSLSKGSISNKWIHNTTSSQRGYCIFWNCISSNSSRLPLKIDPRTSFMSRRSRVIKKIDKAYVQNEFRTISPQYYVGRNRSCR